MQTAVGYNTLLCFYVVHSQVYCLYVDDNVYYSSRFVCCKNGLCKASLYSILWFIYVNANLILCGNL